MSENSIRERSKVKVALDGRMGHTMRAISLMDSFKASASTISQI